jgi:hypothetical protein
MDQSYRDSVLKFIPLNKRELLDSACDKLGYGSGNEFLISIFKGIDEDEKLFESWEIVDEDDLVVKMVQWMNDSEELAEFDKSMEKMDPKLLTVEEAMVFGNLVSGLVSAGMQNKNQTKNGLIARVTSKAIKLFFENMHISEEMISESSIGFPVDRINRIANQEILIERVRTDLTTTEIREFFKVLCSAKNESKGLILSEEDLDQFLSANFVGFEPQAPLKLLSPKIKNKEALKKLIHRFWHAKDDYNYSKKSERYAQLLLDNFDVFSDDSVANITKHFSRNDGFDPFGLE